MRPGHFRQPIRRTVWMWTPLGPRFATIAMHPSFRAGLSPYV